MDSAGQPTHEQNIPRYFRWYTVQQTRDISNGTLFNRLEVYYPIPVSSLSLSLCIFFISCDHHATSHQNLKLQTLSMTLNSLKTIHSTYSTHFKNVTSFSIVRQSQDISQQLVRRDGEPVNLLLISKVVEGETRSHYVWIKNINRLLYDQNKYGNQKHFCLRCLCSFNTEESLAKHTPECKRVSAGEPARVTLPTDPTLKFVNHAKVMKAPFLIYADSEAIVTPHENDGGNTTRFKWCIWRKYSDM